MEEEFFVEITLDGVALVMEEETLGFIKRSLNTGLGFEEQKLGHDVWFQGNVYKHICFRALDEYRGIYRVVYVKNYDDLPKVFAVLNKNMQFDLYAPPRLVEKLLEYTLTLPNNFWVDPPKPQE